MKFLSLLFLISLLTACGGGHDKAGSGETSKTVVVGNWPSKLETEEDSPFLFDPQVKSTLDGLLIFQAENLPEWVVLDGQTGVLTGNPGDSESGQSYKAIKLFGMNGGSKAIEIGPFSITVKPVNDAPQIADQALVLSYANGKYTGLVNYEDVDNTLAQLTFSISNQPDYLNASIVAGSNELSIAPTDIAAFSNPQLIDVTINDGKLDSRTAKLSVTFSDDSEVAFSSRLLTGMNIATPSSISFRTSQPLSVQQLTSNQQAGACTGTVQISKDNFASCLKATITANALNTEFSVHADFEALQEYKFKVINGIRSVFDSPLAENFERDFTTMNQLVISEVSGSSYINRHRWIEIYNASSAVVDLSGYAIRTEVIVDDGNNGTRTAPQLFDLPTYNLNSGQYVLLRSQDMKKTLSNTQHVIYLGGNNEYPFWWDTGFVELVNTSTNQTTDYIGFGGSYLRESYKPLTSTAWVGELLPAKMFDAETAETNSYVRNAFLHDSNKSDDWSISEVVTPGYSNDVTCLIDSDGDGFFDCTEEPGATFAGVDIYSLGARNGQKDIFIEVDYMDSTDPNIKPRQRALEKVVEAFAEKDIVVHFDAGALFEEKFNLGGGNKIDFVECLSFYAEIDCENFYDVKSKNIDLNRIYSFHYMIFANQEKDSGFKGRAEILGNDISITMGGWKNPDGSNFTENQIINYQAGLIMHELGHNLGLRHGGNIDLNYKPNYVSSMNYIYDTEGLPTIGDAEGNRYYKFWFADFNNCFEMDGRITNPATGNPDDFKIGYSDGHAVSILELAVNESAGLGHIGSVPVDFNCDGEINQNKYKRSLADTTSVERFEELKDHDDWSAINLVFQSSYDSLTSRAGKARGSDEDLPVLFMGDDRGEISQEYPRR